MMTLPCGCVLDGIGVPKSRCLKHSAAAVEVFPHQQELAAARDTITALRGHLASSRERVGQLMAANEEQRKISTDALELYGVNKQFQVAMEECGELIVAISHYLRGRDGSVQELAEEIADVELVLVSLRETVGGSCDIDAIKTAKWERLRARVARSRDREAQEEGP